MVAFPAGVIVTTEDQTRPQRRQRRWPLQHWLPFLRQQPRRPVHPFFQVDFKLFSELFSYDEITQIKPWLFSR